MNKSKIEDLYDNLQETIVDDIENDDKIETLWNEINEIDELLKILYLKKIIKYLMSIYQKRQI